MNNPTQMPLPTRAAPQRDGITIGALSEATAVSASALRYYDELGLIKTAYRVGGKRRFSPNTIDQVNFIQHAKEAGFSLEEAKNILEGNNTSHLISKKIEDLSDQKNRLETMIQILRSIEGCRCGEAVTCPRLDQTPLDPKKPGGHVSP